MLLRLACLPACVHAYPHFPFLLPACEAIRAHTTLLLPLPLPLLCCNTVMLRYGFCSIKELLAYYHAHQVKEGWGKLRDEVTREEFEKALSSQSNRSSLAKSPVHSPSTAATATATATATNQDKSRQSSSSSSSSPAKQAPNLARVVGEVCCTSTQNQVG